MTTESDLMLDELLVERDRLRRDITGLRHELAGIAIFMQERRRLSDPGGRLFALVHGAVVTYILELERQRAHWLAKAIEAADEVERLRGQATCTLCAGTEWYVDEFGLDQACHQCTPDEDEWIGKPDQNDVLDLPHLWCTVCSMMHEQCT